MTKPARRHITARHTLALAALAVAATVTAAGPVSAASSPTAVPTAAATSRIASAAVHTCLDTSTTDPAHYFLDIYGHRCSGSAASQSFTFTPVTGTATGTYQVGTSTAGQCVVKYRYGLRQAACPATPNPSYDEWTLQPVGSSGRAYQMTLASGAACVQADPRPHGYPGPIFSVHACSGAANQVFTLAAGLA